MSAGLPSDEVADDYKNSLEDLVTNDRYQIGNLTVIAKENIEHGEAIARVLENHIQRVGNPLSLVSTHSPNVGFSGLFGKRVALPEFPPKYRYGILSSWNFLIWNRHHPLENSPQSMYSIQLSRTLELHTLSISDATSTTLL
jgi:hypothetical protein